MLCATCSVNFISALFLIHFVRAQCYYNPTVPKKGSRLWSQRRWASDSYIPKVKRDTTFSYIYVNNEFLINKLKEFVYGNDICTIYGDENSKGLKWRVIGGTDASYGSQPWQVELVVTENGKFKHHCSGVIISSAFIITAAHCLKKANDQKLLKVIVGNHHLNVKDSFEVEYAIDKFLIHPKHTKANIYNNDIALIKVKLTKPDTGIQFNSHVQPACIPTHSTLRTPETKCVVSGWGNTDGESAATNVDVLQSADIELLSTSQCRELYKNYIPVEDGMLCAGQLEGGVDSCRGDSGGPLICNVSNSLVLMGLVSWGEGCGQPYRPGVYVNVQYYIEWIHQSINEMS